MTHASAPKGYNTINSFIITKDAIKLISFLITVFGAEEDRNSHTVDSDGLLLHSELSIGNSRVMVAESKPDWPYTPGLLQIYVQDVEATLAKAEELGGEIVTKPTDFYGAILSRMKDPFGNLWWVYQHNPAAETNWDEGNRGDDADAYSDADALKGGEEVSWEPSEEMTYIHDTLLKAMDGLKP
jgi:PhnB protein